MVFRFGLLKVKDVIYWYSFFFVVFMRVGVIVFVCYVLFKVVIVVGLLFRLRIVCLFFLGVIVVS